MYENRTYLIFSVSEINLIDFNQVLETSPETIRKSIDETMGVIKWEGNTPSCVESLTTKSQFYTHEEILEIMDSSEWKQSYPY